VRETRGISAVGIQGIESLPEEKAQNGFFSNLQSEYDLTEVNLIKETFEKIHQRRFIYVPFLLMSSL